MWPYDQPFCLIRNYDDVVCDTLSHRLLRRFLVRGPKRRFVFLDARKRPGHRNATMPCDIGHLLLRKTQTLARSVPEKIFDTRVDARRAQNGGELARLARSRHDVLVKRASEWGAAFEHTANERAIEASGHTVGKAFVMDIAVTLYGSVIEQAFDTEHQTARIDEERGAITLRERVGIEILLGRHNAFDDNRNIRLNIGSIYYLPFFEWS